MITVEHLIFGAMCKERRSGQMLPLTTIALSPGGHMSKSRLALLLATLAVAAPSSPVHADGAGPSLYSITDLGAFSANTVSVGLGLNSSGQVAGYSLQQGGYPVVKHSTFWSHGSAILLPTLAGPSVTGSELESANAVSSSGWVVGRSVTSNGSLHAYLWTSANGIQDLGVFPQGRSSSASGINASGAVVGSADIYGLDHAFLWISGNGLQDLGTFGGQSSYAAAINATNQVVGVADTSNQYQHAFLWSSAHGLQDLGVEPGDYVSSASAINDSGAVVGSSGSGQWWHAFLWDSAHGMQDLGTLGGTFTFGYGVNASGQAVGSSLPAGNIGAYNAFVWDAAHGMRDLNTLIPPSEWHLTQANAINASGQITGVGSINGATHAFLLTPAPPLSLTLTPSTVVNGASSTATVSLNAYATTGPNPFDGGAIEPGVFVQVASSKPAAILSGNVFLAPDGKTYVYIPQGQWQATFTIYTSVVTANTTATITASFPGGSRTANLTITPTPIQSLTLSPASIVNGGQSTGTVTLVAPAYIGLDPNGNVQPGAFVKLTTSSPVASFGGGAFTLGPNLAYVYIPQGSTQATFTVNTGYAAASTTAKITAAFGSSSMSVNLAIASTLVQSVTLSPASVVNGGSSTGTVTLASPAFLGPDPNGDIGPGVFVKLTTSSPAASFGGGAFTLGQNRSYVYIPQGSTQATFTVNAGLVAASTTAKITAANGASAKTANLTITPTLVQSIVLSPTSVLNGGQANATITLATPAFLGPDLGGNIGSGVFVKLTSAASAATFGGNVINNPGGASYVYIPQGQTQATFTINAGWVPAAKAATITASLNTSSKSATLTINPTLVQSVVVSPTSVVNGDQSMGTVTLAMPAFMGPDLGGIVGPGVFVKLTTSASAATFGGGAFAQGPNSAYVYIPQGSTQATFTVNAGFVAASTTATISASLSNSVKTASLKITPTLVQSIVLSPTTIAGGAQTSATVTLASPAFIGADLDGNLNPGVYVKLDSSNMAASFGGNAFVASNGNAYVYIPQGSTQATFLVGASPVPAKTTSAITASLNGAAHSATLTITP
ncbi:hypothetical protein CCAX7_18380 [Capsulimonas corticalis]|uniref:Uncharacterized protein n=2 Tax=Capsulimonas corticalis TaxID=2219043 RepID=A0A9N7L176_9BACT|nr:hypothetical protein CCAX7_18380 [Capsulimonas corticalis]